MGELRLEVDPLIKDFEEVMFKPESGVIDKIRDPRRTHTSDALGNVIWELFGERPSASEMNKRLF